MKSTLNVFTKEFKVSEFLSRRLENLETVIYVAGSRFNQCKALLFTIPLKDKDKLATINSIDDFSEILNLDPQNGQQGIYYDISPEEEFMGHCSNIQVWWEYAYDSRLLHSNLSFPLLKDL